MPKQKAFAPPGSGEGRAPLTKPVEIIPASDRVATGRTVVKQVVDVPRCAARVKAGQCTGLVGASGANYSGFVLIDGERVPFCGRHYSAAGGV